MAIHRDKGPDEVSPSVYLRQRSSSGLKSLNWRGVEGEFLIKELETLVGVVLVS